jgi:hypothetical protein
MVNCPWHKGDRIRSSKWKLSGKLVEVNGDNIRLRLLNSSLVSSWYLWKDFELCKTRIKKS